MCRDLKKRTQGLGLDVLRFSATLPEGTEYWVIRRQLVRCATSVGANYRSACRSRSKKDFVSRLGIVAEEADEVLYWLEVLERFSENNSTDLCRLKQETNELVAIMVSSIHTSRKTLEKDRKR